MIHRCALITGAGGGLGSALVNALEKKGLKLVLLDKGSLPYSVAPHDYYQVDFLNLDHLSARLDEIIPKHPTLDLIIANAGIDIPCRLTSPNPMLARDHLVINTLANYVLLSKVLPFWLKRKRGHFVSIASLAALRGFPYEGAYCASKSALACYMEAARAELEPHGIHFTTVFPGYIGTPLIEKNAFKITRSMTPDQAAQKIIAAIEKRKRNVYFPLTTFLLIRFLNMLPAFLSDRLARTVTDFRKIT